MEEDKEKEDLKQCFKIVQDDEVAIDAIPLATKHAPIINFQIHRKGRNGYYEIMRADESAKTYLLVTAAKLMLLVQKFLLLVLKVNVAGMKITTAERLQLLEEFMLIEKRSKTYQRKMSYLWNRSW
ncbi:hypothetical protein Tco_0205426 [Tanacetum coccineum]